MVCLIAKIEANPAEEKAKPEASKELKDAIKKAKEEQMSKKNCAKACTMNIDPVCAHDPADANYKPRTFANSCALEVHNCEMGASEYRAIFFLG